MATVRIVKVSGGKYGGSATAIDGVQGFGWRHEYDVLSSLSDGALGFTSHDLVGMRSSGRIIVENMIQVATIIAAAQGQLIYQYKVAGSTAKKRTYDKVSYDKIGPVEFQSEPGGGTIRGYALEWKGIFAAADATIDDHVAVAADT